MPKASPARSETIPTPVTEDDLVTSVCDFGYRTRRLDDLCSGKQVVEPSVICVMGESGTLSKFFTHIVPEIKARFTLISIEHDDSVPPKRGMLDEPKLTAWYGWNKGTHHPKLHALPIGLNKGRHLSGIVKQMSRNNIKNGRMLVNFNLDRNERKHVWDLSKSWSSFADRVAYDTGLASQRAGVVGTTTGGAYYEMLSRYTFVVCPKGLGIDTHRFWEALYLGAIPVVLKSTISELYEGLPVIQLERWEDLTHGVLQKAKKTIAQTSFDFRRLDLHYWIALINGEKPATSNKILWSWAASFQRYEVLPILYTLFLFLAPF